MDRFLTRALSFTSVALFALISARLISQDPAMRSWSCWWPRVRVPALLSRRRMRRLLLSGDVPRILGTWQGSLTRVTYPETMAPLMTATAYAAYGFIDAARSSLSRAARGPAWEAAVEQRLFVEALLDVYEGERSSAMTKATELERLPLPSASFWMRRKISLLRRGTAAMARAFAHESRVRRRASSPPRLALLAAGALGDALRAGRRAGRWRRKAEALELIAAAPSWPNESAFPGVFTPSS